MREETPEEARQRASEYRRLVDSVEKVLHRYDPIGIGDNPGEYAGEAESIAPRLASAGTVEDVQRIVHEEFVRWFDSETAGPAGRYQAIAVEIWTIRGR